MSFSGGEQGHSAPEEETGVRSRQSVSKPHGHPPIQTPQCLTKACPLLDLVAH